MTKEEAIKVLDQVRQWTDYPKEAFTMAIEALTEPSLPSDLDEASEEYVSTLCDRVDEGLRIDTTLESAFKAGAKWDREQMLKEAVEGWVAVDSDTDGKRRVTFFPQKPVRDVLTEYKYWAATRPMYESIKLDSNAFPSLKWEDEPKKVKLIIIKEDSHE